jgi:CubicO group peptidase (beta-lactamase class C family)
MALEPTVDPTEVGVDPARLPRIDELTHRYVDQGLFPFVQIVVSRRGEIVHHDSYGYADRDSDRPYRDDCIARVYSMTKPVTSVALMMLYERGLVRLEDPVSRYLPAFANPRVFTAGDPTRYDTREAAREMTVQDVLTHISGLTYGFQHQHPVDAIYRQHNLGDFTPSNRTLAEEMELLGSLPLQFDPGTKWCYSMSTDVCGALVEVISGVPLDEFFQAEIFDPLGMPDTAFWVEGDDRCARFTTNHLFFGGTTSVMDRWDKSGYLRRPPMLSGGGGLVSTMADYLRFTWMLERGGELDGVRLLSPKTVAYMASNHMPGGRDLNQMEQQGFAESYMNGMGFGLGFSVNLSPQENAAIGSVGDYGWGGAASTAFRIDPAEELSWVFFTQLLPSSTYPVRRELAATIYQALVD